MNERITEREIRLREDDQVRDREYAERYGRIRQPEEGKPVVIDPRWYDMD